MYYKKNYWPGGNSSSNAQNIGHYAPGKKLENGQYVLDTDQLASFPNEFNNKYFSNRMPKLKDG